MASPAPSSRVKSSIGLDELAALHRELAALAEAGFPLETGLAQLADDWNRPAGALAARLHDALAQGRSLPEALAAEHDAMPRWYAAALQAGLRAGALGPVLHGLADHASQAADLRRSFINAMAYPCLVAAIAWTLLTWLGVAVVPQFIALGMGESLWLAPLAGLGDWLLPLSFGVAAAGASGALLWLRRSRSATLTGGPWLPGSRRLRRLTGQAQFAAALALLTECETPLEEALVLSGQASGLPALADASHQLASRLQAGHSPGTSRASGVSSDRELPALVLIALLAPGNAAQCSGRLRDAANIYRERAVDWLTWIAWATPLVSTVVAAGGVALVYALTAGQAYLALHQELWKW